MSIHPSLRIDRWKEKRNVRKRYERLRSLALQKKWDAKKDSVFKLPKEKIVRLKIKKEEKEVKEIVPLDKLILPTVNDKKTKKQSKDVGKIK